MRIGPMMRFRRRKRNTFLLLLISLVFLSSCGQLPQKSLSETKSLTVLSVDPIKTVKHTQKFIDPVYGTQIHQVTSAEDGQGRMRHEYSRRQAFNADGSLLLAQDGAGYWFLYKADSLKLIKPLPELVGDAEPIWHSSDPDKLYFTSRGGGPIWWMLDIHTDKKVVAFDLTGQTPWPEATAYWTKGEGTTSADGHYLALIASHYDEGNQENKVYGLLLVDLQKKKIVGQLDAKDFPMANAMPDHVSTAPSGKFIVASWLAEDGGTWAFGTDFSTSRQLAQGSEHSDLAIGAEGQDLLVYADYQAGQIRAIDVATGVSNNLHPLYPAEGEGYALHISGQAFERPGWVVISTYSDYADYGQTSLAPKLRAEYQKIWLMELKSKGRKLNLTHVRSKTDVVREEDGYFLEPQASASRDLTKVVFASNMGGDIESYVIHLPDPLLD